MSIAFDAIGDHWRDDAFKRQAYASFLTAFLTGKVTGRGSLAPVRHFTMALDATWGSGKTFFLSRWAKDLQATVDGEPGYTVVSFDAWAADYAEDPLVAFMSELRSELRRALQSSGLEPRVQAAALQAVDTATKKFRHLVLPLGGVIAKAVLHKLSGVDLEELAEVAMGPSSAAETVLDKVDGKTVGDIAPIEKADEALDRLFNAQLDEHGERKQAIADFKKEIGVAIRALSPGAEAKPLFVLVDELDRCKPSFAVGLLEAIKHVFDVPGLCIVVATNMDQLSHTVKAVYGEGFDARSYLQRFFDSIYALPAASGPQQLGVWVKQRSVFEDSRCRWAMPGNGFESDEFGARKEGMLAWVFSGLRLPLRSQNQVLDLMEAAALGQRQDRQIHVMWLAIVCGLWHSHRPAFAALETACKSGGGGHDVSNSLGLNIVKRTYCWFDQHARGARREAQFSLADLVAAYSVRGTQDLVRMLEKHEGGRGPKDVIDAEILKDAPRMYGSEACPTGLLDYFLLVRTAGHLVSD